MQMNMAYHGRQVMLTYEMPLAEIVLTSISSSRYRVAVPPMDYEFKNIARLMW